MYVGEAAAFTGTGMAEGAAGTGVQEGKGVKEGISFSPSSEGADVVGVAVLAEAELGGMQ